MKHKTTEDKNLFFANLFTFSKSKVVFLRFQGRLGFRVRFILGLWIKMQTIANRSIGHWKGMQHTRSVEGELFRK
jgi:hypothetical protein